MLKLMSDYIDIKTGLIKNCFIENSKSDGTLVYWQKVNGGHIQVRECEQLRWLLINDTVQSIINTHDPLKILLPHLAYLTKQWQQLCPPNNVLELGLGGGAIRNYLSHSFPSATITSVEKSADIIEIYSRFFSQNKSEHLLCDDAQHVLNAARNIDWIILDLFSEIDAPRFLFEEAFYEKIYLALNTNGMLFINFLSQHESQLKQLQQLLFNVFGYTVYPQKIADYVNHIIVISKKP